MTIYRFYENGIRYTVECKTQEEARQRFEQAKQDHSEEFARGNQNIARSTQSQPNVAKNIKILNAFDAGYVLGHAGFKTVPKKVLRAMPTYDECLAARAGLVAAQMLSEN